MSIIYPLGKAMSLVFLFLTVWDLLWGSWQICKILHKDLAMAALVVFVHSFYNGIIAFVSFLYLLDAYALLYIIVKVALRASIYYNLEILCQFFIFKLAVWGGRR